MNMIIGLKSKYLSISILLKEWSGTKIAIHMINIIISSFIHKIFETKFSFHVK